MWFGGSLVGYIDGHHRAHLTGYDGYHAVIEAGEKVETSNILGIKSESTSPTPKSFFTDSVSLVYVTTYRACDRFFLSINLYYI